MGYVLGGLGLFLTWVQVFGEQATVATAVAAAAHQAHVWSLTAPLAAWTLVVAVAAGWEVRAVFFTDAVSGYYARRRFLRNSAIAAGAIVAARTLLT